jgi:hypothetical protein
VTQIDYLQQIAQSRGYPNIDTWHRRSPWDFDHCAKLWRIRQQTQVHRQHVAEALLLGFALLTFFAWSIV